MKCLRLAAEASGLQRAPCVAWFAETVIGRNMLDFGLSGWMADFGEYQPTNVRLASGLDGMLAHNAWPALWARVNAEAVASRGTTGEALVFTRAGDQSPYPLVAPPRPLNTIVARR